MHMGSSTCATPTSFCLHLRYTCAIYRRSRRYALLLVPDSGWNRYIFSQYFIVCRLCSL